MLTIERNTRGLRDSLAVHFLQSLTFTLATTTVQLALLFQGPVQCGY